MPRMALNQAIAPSQTKYLKSNNGGSIERAVASGKQNKQHSRMGSYEFIGSSGQAST
jgi:hypothetical protein